MIYRTHIPSNHEGSLTSSIVNRALSSIVDINFRRGAEGVDAYFFPTGYITCNITNFIQGGEEMEERMEERILTKIKLHTSYFLRIRLHINEREKKERLTCKYIFCGCLQGHPCTILFMFISIRGTANLTSSGYAKIQRHIYHGFS